MMKCLLTTNANKSSIGKYHFFCKNALNFENLNTYYYYYYLLLKKNHVFIEMKCRL
jgi:hypothetical protein